MRLVLCAIALLLSVDGFAALPAKLKDLKKADITAANIGAIVDLMHRNPEQYMDLRNPELVALAELFKVPANIATLTLEQAQRLQAFIDANAEDLKARTTSDEGKNVGGKKLGQALTLKATNDAIAARIKAEEKKITDDKAKALKDAGIAKANSNAMEVLTMKVANLKASMDINALLTELNNGSVVAELIKKNLERLPSQPEFCEAITNCADETDNKTPVKLDSMFKAPITH